jgi:hypothetical protein
VQCASWTTVDTGFADRWPIMDEDLVSPVLQLSSGESASGTASLAERCDKRELHHWLHNRKDLAAAPSAR